MSYHAAARRYPAPQVSRPAPILHRREIPAVPSSPDSMSHRLLVVLKGPLAVMQAYAPPSVSLSAFTGASAFVVWLMGDRAAMLLIVMCAALAGDVLTGSLRALADGTFEGRKFYTGVARKTVRAQLVSFGCMMDWTFHIALGVLWPDASVFIASVRPLTMLAIVSLIGYEVSGGVEHVRATWPNMPRLYAIISGKMAAGDVRGAAQVALDAVAVTPKDAPPS